MPFQVSPGVAVVEVDLAGFVPAVATTDGAMAGAFKWGPLNTIVSLGNEDQLVSRFGKPTDDLYIHFFCAANFLAYSNNLRIVRVVDEDGALNATSEATTGSNTPGTGILIKNDDDYEINYASGAGNVGLWAAKFPGDLGNSLKVSLCASADAFRKTLTGRLASSGTAVTGTSTLFSTELIVGSILVSEAGEQRQVTAIASNTALTIDSAFTTALGTLTAITGTSATSGTTTVTGTGTLFLIEVSVGDVLQAPNGEQRVVATITSNTVLTVDTAFTVDLGTGANASGILSIVSNYEVDGKWEYADEIGIAPGTTEYAELRGGSDDEMHLVVVDEDGLIDNIPGQVLERFSFMSKAGDAKSQNGASNYYADVINQQSNFVRWMDHLPAGTNWGDDASGTSFISPILPNTRSLTGGDDGATISSADAIRGYDKFKNAEEVDVSLIIGANAAAATILHIIDNICETRKDCMAFFSPEFADVVNNAGDEADDVIQFRNILTSSSYAAMDCNWKLQYDKYNDTNRWIPCNADVAGLCVRTDQLRDPWYSPAGFNRGILKNVIRLAFNPDKGDRDDLYLKGINPIVSFPGQGSVLYGDKTLLAKPSAFDRINVRRLFIVLEKAIAKAAQNMLFEFNDDTTRLQFRGMIEPFLRDVQAKRGLIDFRVVCDTTNNTPEVIDRNEFIGDIYLKPSKSINFITLNFVAVRTGVQFEEIVGRF